jgi:glycosyltransferase involved in cell wall biosynthesis
MISMSYNEPNSVIYWFSMKKILVEMEKLKNLNSGLGQFCLHLGKQFQLLPHPELEIDFYLPKHTQGLFGNPSQTIKQSPVHKYLPYRKKSYDIWHCLHQDSDYLPPRGSAKLILTIHDLNFIEKYKGPKKILKLKKLQNKIDRADAITVISHYTEQAVLNHLDVRTKKIHVITNGNPLEKIANPTRPDFVNFDEFLFTIGIISPKKNFHTLIPLLALNPKLHLVIAGIPHGTYIHELIDLAKKHQVEERIHFPGAVNNEQKNWLYQNCKAFVFPSLQEGFGLPVVEAMSMGIPVFLSDRTSLPEIGGEEAFYWKNFDQHAMNQILQAGIQQFDSERAARSRVWAGKFSWVESAKKYLELYANC